VACAFHHCRVLVSRPTTGAAKYASSSSGLVVRRRPKPLVSRLVLPHSAGARSSGLAARPRPDGANVLASVAGVAVRVFAWPGGRGGRPAYVAARNGRGQGSAGEARASRRRKQAAEGKKARSRHKRDAGRGERNLSGHALQALIGRLWPAVQLVRRRTRRHADPPTRCIPVHHVRKPGPQISGQADAAIIRSDGCPLMRDAGFRVCIRPFTVRSHRTIRLRVIFAEH
jgi:hypothetical protein